MILVAVIFLLVSVVVLSWGMLRLSDKVRDLDIQLRSKVNGADMDRGFDCITRIDVDNNSRLITRLERRVDALEINGVRPKKIDLGNMTEKKWEDLFRERISHYQKGTQVIVLKGWRSGRYCDNKLAVRALIKLINEYGRKGVASANGGGVSE